ncbi:MAG: hypothetical protein AAF490_26865 [Chloroflexota bacterium]
MSQSIPKQLSQIPRWKFLYAFVLLFCWVGAGAFQIGNPGWFLILFGLVYCVTFPLHIAYWGITIIQRTAVNNWNHLSFFGSNLLFFLANALNVDFGDTHSYMFFMQYENPPEVFLAISVGLYVLWFIALMIEVGFRVARYYANRPKTPPEAT